MARPTKRRTKETIGARAPRRRARIAALTIVAGLGCAPTVDVAGVYFPGWLVSAAAGAVGAYGIVLWLARRPGTRELADSGLLFVSLVAGIAFAVWWVFFSSF